MIEMPLKAVTEAAGAGCAGDSDEALVRRVVTDSREARAGDLFFAIRGARADGHAYVDEAAAKGVVGCVVDRRWAESGGGRPGVPCLVVEDTVAALGRLAAYYRREVLPSGIVVVGITGSNGKTTTKCMIDHLLRPDLPGRASPKSYNNQIGLPLTLLSAEAGDRYVLVEIGTNAPGEVASLAEIASPSAGVITSVGKAHLEGLGDVEAVAREKAGLLGHIRAGGIAVVNVDEPAIRPYVTEMDGVLPICFGADTWALHRTVVVEATMSGTTFILEGRYRIELGFPGAHHAANAAAAFYVARWLGVAPRAIIERLRGFEPPPGRTRTLRAQDVTVVDDAYNANPTSVAAAARTLARARPGRRVFVLGDMLELGAAAAGHHVDAARTIVSSGIEVLVAVGPLSSSAARLVKEQANGATRVVACADVESASSALEEVVRPGDVVWVKGSRAMGLERMVSGLAGPAARLPGPAETSAAAATVL